MVVVRELELCRCDGSGWIISLDRRRYSAPATDDMLIVSRCSSLHAGRARERATDGRERDVAAQSS